MPRQPQETSASKTFAMRLMDEAKRPLTLPEARVKGFTGASGSWRSWKWEWEKTGGSSVSPMSGTTRTDPGGDTSLPQYRKPTSEEAIPFATGTEWTVMNLKVRTSTHELYNRVTALAESRCPGVTFPDFATWLSQCPHDLFRAYGIELGLIYHAGKEDAVDKVEQGRPESVQQTTAKAEGPKRPVSPVSALLSRWKQRHWGRA